MQKRLKLSLRNQESRSLPFKKSSVKKTRGGVEFRKLELIRHEIPVLVYFVNRSLLMFKEGSNADIFLSPAVNVLRAALE